MNIADLATARRVLAYRRLEEAVPTLLSVSSAIEDFTPYGTSELPVALARLRAVVEYPGQVNDMMLCGARQVSSAFTMTPIGALELEDDRALSFTGVVMAVRADLAVIDHKAATHETRAGR